MIKIANNLINLVLKQSELTLVKQSEWWNPMSWFGSSSPAQVATPPAALGSMESQFERADARQQALDQQLEAGGLMNKGPQQVRGGAVIGADGRAVDPARQAQVDKGNAALRANGMTTAPAARPITTAAPAARPAAPVARPAAPVARPTAPVARPTAPVAPAARPRGVPSGQGGAGIDED